MIGLVAYKFPVIANDLIASRVKLFTFFRRPPLSRVASLIRNISTAGM